MEQTHVTHLIESSATDIYLGRQPILNRGKTLVGYELLFRRNRMGAAGVTNTTQASAQVLENTLGTFNLSAVLNGHPGHINFGRNLLMSDALLVLPTKGFVLEILEDVELDEPVIARCHSLHAAGYRLALDDVSPQRSVPDAVLDAIDIVKIDLACTPRSQWFQLINRFRRAGKTVLAEKVETQEEFEHAKMLGCELFQGFFFAHPDVLVCRKAPSCRAPLLRLLAVVSGQPRMDELTEALKLTPEIAIQVLRLANAAQGGRGPIDTLRTAIMRVGTRQLSRWAQLLMYAQNIDVPLRSNALVQLVSTRARFMELAAHRIESGHANSELPDRAYLTGMLSMVHLALQMDSADLLEQLGVDAEIRVAIELRAGCLGGLLACAEAVDTQDESVLEASCQRWPMLDRETIAELAFGAAEWTAQHCG